MKSRRTFIKATVLSTALASIGLASFGALAADTIKVGVLHSLSGTMAISETALKETVLMTIDEINKAGGVNGKKFSQFGDWDLGNRPADGLEALKEINHHGVALVEVGKNAAGKWVYPPLWGDESFNIGAGMARTYTAAAFVKRNMPIGMHNKFPLGQGGLSDQEALDVAEYFSHQPRPDFPDKVKDWPKDKKPDDARY